MTWVRLDDQFADHPKVIDVGPLAGWLHVKALVYCGRYLTDGRIPCNAVTNMVDWESFKVMVTVSEGEFSAACDTPSNLDLAEKLVEVGMWEKRDGAFYIHDYLKYQPSKAKVMAEREATARRVGKHRNASCNAVTEGVSNGVSNAVSNTAPDPDPVPVPKEKKETDHSPEFFAGPDLGVADNDKQERVVKRNLAGALKVLEHLNAARSRVKPKSTGIRASYSSLGLIAARLNAGKTVDECLAIIRAGEAEVRKNPDAWIYFDQITPWRAENFEKRIAAAVDTNAPAQGTLSVFAKIKQRDDA